MARSPNTIELPKDVDLIKFIQDAYELSSPQGLGHMHFTPEPLSEIEAQSILDRFKNNPTIVATLDYINGRAVKMTIFKDADGIYIRDDWYDHTKAEFYRLLQRTKVKGIKIDRDIKREELIMQARSKNPFATTPNPHGENPDDE